MKLNEVLDVFGNESLEITMTPEQEYKASLESIIEEIDNVMEIKAGLEDMEMNAVEYAKASCESLLTGLAVREISIANEDLDLRGLCASFGVKPALFGLEEDEPSMKEKIKDKAGKAYSAINNSRIVKAVKFIIKKIIDIIINFFSLNNIFSKMIISIIKNLNKLGKKETYQNLRPSVLVSRMKSFFNIIDRYNNCKNYINEVINHYKASEKGMTIEEAQKFAEEIMKGWKQFETPEPGEEGIGESLDPRVWIKKGKDLLDKMKTKAPTKEEIKETVKDVEPSLGKKILSAFQKLMAKIRTAAKKAGAAIMSAFKNLKDKAKDTFKKKEEGSGESVAFGMEALDSIFGEISRIDYGFEGEIVVPEEYEEIGIEGMSFFEELDALEDTIEAVESVEELYIEAAIPSQIAALESIAIEKGLNPDSGVSFDLFGNMSAGIEASDEVVENASEETKKTMRERAAGAFGKVKSVIVSAFAFIKNKFVGLSSIKKALKAIKAGIKNMTPEEMKEFMAENSANVNRLLVLTNVVKVFLNPFSIMLSFFVKNPLEAKKDKLEELRAQMKEAMKIEDSKSHTINQMDSRLIDMAITVIDKYEKNQKGFIANARVIKGYLKQRGGMIVGLIKDYLRMARDMAKDFGAVLVAGLKGAKSLVVELKNKIKSNKSKNTEELVNDVTEEFSK